MRDLILYFLLLVLEIPLDLGPDASYKRDRFSKTLPEKGLKFVLSRRNNIVAFNVNFVLLLIEVNPILEEQSRKGDMFVACGSGCIKMILTLLTETIALYMRAPIVKVEVPSLEGFIPRGGVCLAIFLAIDKQF